MRRFLTILAVLLLTACAQAEPEAPIRERFSGTAVADAVLRERVLLDTATYWALIRSGDWQAAYDRYTYDYRERVPFAEWQAMGHDRWAGPPRVVSIHWTQGAHAQHGPELYAIVEWSARAGPAGSEGALIWRQNPDGSFSLEDSVQRKLVRPPA